MDAENEALRADLNDLETDLERNEQRIADLETESERIPSL
jgi:predicted nuclease with TOPRIM domain